MSIEEKAEEYRSNTFGTPFRNDIKMAFSEGAQWMFEKAVKWLKENAQNYYEASSIHDNYWYDDEQMIEDFQKAMKE